MDLCNNRQTLCTATSPTYQTSQIGPSPSP
nr:MAG TPA: hypothetical protein [Caudoviricetes sp.]